MENAKIAMAFVAAQKKFNPALKTSVNQHFKNRYADLASCIDAVIEALNDAGIALIQRVYECDNGVIVETVFLHESGESLEAGKLHVPATKTDAQGYGSALTYARRYSLMAACGIAPEDDDGNAAVKASEKPPQSPPAGQKKKTYAEYQQEVDKLASADSVLKWKDRNKSAVIRDLTEDEVAKLSRYCSQIIDTFNAGK
jgi:hypothetical protein